MRINLISNVYLGLFILVALTCSPGLFALIPLLHKEHTRAQILAALRPRKGTESSHQDALIGATMLKEAANTDIQQSQW